MLIVNGMCNRAEDERSPAWGHKKKPDSILGIELKLRLHRKITYFLIQDHGIMFELKWMP